MNLIVGYDEHPASRAALKFAAGLSRRLDAELNVIHVVTMDDYPIDPDNAEWEANGERELAAEREDARRILQAHGASRWTYDVLRGEPVRLLVEACERHDAAMIIVGKPEQGLGAMLGHLVSGSISRGILHRSHRPVIIVPENSDSPGGNSQ